MPPNSKGKEKQNEISEEARTANRKQLFSDTQWENALTYPFHHTNNPNYSGCSVELINK